MAETINTEKDDELLEIGKRFEAAYEIEEAARTIARETDDWSTWDAAYEETGQIVKQIESLPASTLQGLRIKARAVQWCYGDDPITIDEIQDSTDLRLSAQIVRDLLRIAA